VHFPIKPKGIFSEVKDLHVDWKVSGRGDLTRMV
jgi:hypothetical protein